MNRRDFLKTAGVGLAALSLPKWLAAASSESTPRRKPNIILILSDDVGIADIGCCGGRFQTPNIDALAKGGTRFEYCYATPLCGPSRCELLTGRYPFRTGLINNHSHNAIQPGHEIMIPTMMKEAGYDTASIGKWGQMSYGPGAWGFGEYLVFPGSGCYWRDQTAHYRVNRERKNLPEGRYLPDLMHDVLVDFIARHASAGSAPAPSTSSGQARPFFVYHPMSHIHAPIVRTPDSKPGASREQFYADNIAYMDKLVGKLIGELDRLHLRDNTLVLFTGDNGTARFDIQDATVNGRRILGRKATMLEGGSRVPLIANWPGTTPAGIVNHDLTDFSDFFATIAELGGASLPDRVVLDSHSFAEQIQGGKGHPREWVYVELNGSSYVRNTRFKLTNGGALFDMKDAPFDEIRVPADTKDAEAIAARKRLQEILELHPAAPATAPAGKNQAARPPRRRAPP